MENRIKPQKQVPNLELILYLTSTFLFTNMQGMVGNYRQVYFVNVLHLSGNEIALVNTICNIAGFALPFFYAMLVDRAPKPGKAKFKPYVVMTAVPSGILTVLMFLSPKLSTAPVFGPLSPLMVYLCFVTILHGAMIYFSNTVNNIAIVISEDQAERDTVLTLRGIVNAVGNSGALVLVLVVGLFSGNAFLAREEQRLIFASVLCALFGTAMLLFAMRLVRERVSYSSKKENPLLGFWEVLRNPYALLLLFSEFLQGLRGIGSYMGIFLAAALLGNVDKFILFGLPTGIGTFVGMMLVNLLLKKINNKQIYILFAVFAFFANLGAYWAGLQSFRNPENMLMQVLFFGFLFTMGIPYGATNLLPSMFQADILEDIEVKSHRRVEASIAFIVGLGGTLSGSVIVGYVAPRILLGDYVRYLPTVDQLVDGVMTTVYQEQSYDTKVRMLVLYTIYHGTMILIASLPFIFYKLTGKRKEEIHAKALAYREGL